MLIMLNGSQSSFRDNRCWTSFVDFPGDDLADFDDPSWRIFLLSDSFGLIGVKSGHCTRHIRSNMTRNPKVIQKLMLCICYVYYAL